jgi:hypothetical protein
MPAARPVTSFLVGRRSSILRQGSNEELSSSIVSWNINSCVTLANMQRRLDLVLGSAILAVLFAVMIGGVIFSVV